MGKGSFGHLRSVSVFPSSAGYGFATRLSACVRQRAPRLRERFQSGQVDSQRVPCSTFESASLTRPSTRFHSVNPQDKPEKNAAKLLDLPPPDLSEIFPEDEEYFLGDGGAGGDGQAAEERVDWLVPELSLFRGVVASVLRGPRTGSAADDEATDDLVRLLQIQARRDQQRKTDCSRRAAPSDWLTRRHTSLENEESRLNHRVTSGSKTCRGTKLWMLTPPQRKAIDAPPPAAQIRTHGGKVLPEVDSARSTHLVVVTPVGVRHASPCPEAGGGESGLREGKRAEGGSNLLLCSVRQRLRCAAECIAWDEGPLPDSVRHRPCRARPRRSWTSSRKPPPLRRVSPRCACWIQRHLPPPLI